MAIPRNDSRNFLDLKHNRVMSRKLIKGILTAILPMIAGGLQAQSDTVSALSKPAESEDTTVYVAPKPPGVWSLYAGGLLALPSAEFRSTINNSIFNLAAGVGGGFLVNPFGKKRASPVHIGFDFNYLNYGIDYTDATSTMPPLKTTFNIFTYSLMARLQRPDRTRGFTPFADGMIGIREFATVTKVDKNVSNIVYATDQPEVLSRISDTGLNFGLGAGFLAGRSSLVFTCRLMFLWGREVDYVVRHSVVIDSSGHVNYTKGSTTTSLLMLQIGIQLVE